MDSTLKVSWLQNDDCAQTEEKMEVHGKRLEEVDRKDRTKRVAFDCCTEHEQKHENHEVQEVAHWKLVTKGKMALDRFVVL